MVKTLEICAFFNGEFIGYCRTKKEKKESIALQFLPKYIEKQAHTRFYSNKKQGPR